MTENEDQLEAGEVRYRIEQDPQTGVVTATILAAGWDAAEALKLAASKLTNEWIGDLAAGYEEHRRDQRRKP